MSFFVNSLRLPVAKPVRLVNLCCPICKSENAAELDPAAVEFSCCQCHQVFAITVGMQFLDWAEYLPRRMTAGFVEFACHRVPAWLYDKIVGTIYRLVDFLLWLVPLSAKLVRIAGWVGLSLLIPLGPALVLGTAALGAKSAQASVLALTLVSAGALWIAGVAGAYSWAVWHYRGRKKAMNRRASGSSSLSSADNRGRQPAGK